MRIILNHILKGDIRTIWIYQNNKIYILRKLSGSKNILDPIVTPTTKGSFMC